LSRRGATHLSAIQLNDLFVNLSSLRAAALLDFPQRYALLLNDLFVNLSPLNAPRRAALLLNAQRFISTQLNDLFVNLLSRLDTALGNEPRRNSPCRDAQQLNSTICLSIYSSQLGSAQRNATNRGITYRPAYQRNELKLN
jgi:hypothetical protein